MGHKKDPLLEWVLPILLAVLVTLIMSRAKG